MRYRLVASDLDNTIVIHDPDAQNGLRITPRTSRTLNALANAGVLFVPVTARTPVGLQLVPEQLRQTGWALFGNGCLAQHLETGEVLFEIDIPTDVLRQVYHEMNGQIPGIEAACVREAGQEFTVSFGYYRLAKFSDHGRTAAQMRTLSINELFAEPAAKLIIRHPDVLPADLVLRLNQLGLAGFEATTSGAPFVEIQAAGVTKASGLERLCDHLGIQQNEVVAFGDAANDADMLAWAGYGVAVANAVPETLAAADEVTASVHEDGFAQIVERLLGE